jgi:4-amino-4-deoxy-L-arabinose transferase-like glycosyltransferase
MEQRANGIGASRFRSSMWLVCTIGLTAFFGSVLLVNLDNFRPLSSDDSWIMSISYKLATQGVLGSDMYAGFYNADQHWLINPPVHYISQAISFRIGGAGVAQARWVSVASAIVLIWVVGWLAYLWYGLPAALLTEMLLVLWRSDLIASYTDLPLLAVSRSGRSDLSALAWVWVSIIGLDRYLRKPGWLVALILGFAAGLASLTQFFGVSVVFLIAVALLRFNRKDLPTVRASYWIAAGFLMVVTPFALYALQHLPDLIDQSRLLGMERIQFGSGEFYLSNISREADRFARLIYRPGPNLMLPSLSDPPLSPWLLVIGSVPTLTYLIWRLRRHSVPEVGDRILFSSLVVFEVFLTLFDETKAALYALILLPSICMSFAAFSVAVIRWAVRAPPILSVRFAVACIGIASLAMIILEGAHAYQINQQQVMSVSNYLDVGRKIALYLEPNATVLGTERWWWALREDHYLSLTTLWTKDRGRAEDSNHKPCIREMLGGGRPCYIIVNNNVRGDILSYPVEVQKDFWEFLEVCSVPLAAWTDKSYGQIQIYRAKPAPDAPLSCQSLF